MSGRINMKVKSKRNAKPNQDNVNNPYDPENDASVLKKPFTTSVSNLSSIIKAFNSATHEVQDILTNECDILYECRICRNIFRSLSNFLLHKRSYCQEKYNCVIHLKCANKRVNDYVTINESEESKNESDDDIPVRTTRRTLSTLIESLAQKKQFGVERKNFSISDFYKEKNTDPLNLYYPKKDIQLNLAHINGSSSGVFQTYRNNDNCDNKFDETKLEVEELHDMLENQSAVLGADGKIINFSAGNTVRSSISTAENIDNLTCEECDITFATRKTYMSHRKFKHANTRLVYPCPECSELLSSSWSVYRHLFNIHKKTLSQVKRLRNHVRAKSYYQIQSNSRKSTISAKIDEQQKIDDENQEWMHNFETDNDIQMCGGCGKRFERRAALNSHSQTCQKRIAAQNTIIVNRLKRSATIEEDKYSKLPKLDLPDIKEADGRKLNKIRKRKSGIQIRYDYTKPSDKSKQASIKNYIDINQCSDSSSQDNTDQINMEVTTNTEEIYSIIGVTATRKNTDTSRTDNKENILDSDVVTINSSNNTTPNKDTLQEQDDTDSEIEEIFSASPTEQQTEDIYINKNTTEETTNNDKLDENTVKLIKLFRPNLQPQTNKITLDEKMVEHVDTAKMKCLSCNIQFGNISELRSHMSKHFNWMKYNCEICSYKTYEKIAIIDHINKIHNVDDSTKIESVILQIPEWQTIEMSSEKFVYLDSVKVENILEDSNDVVYIDTEKQEKDTLKENQMEIDMVQPSTANEKQPVPENIQPSVDDIQPPKQGRGRPKKKKPIQFDSKIDESKETQPPKKPEEVPEECSTQKDVALRKMVLEVIFGQNSELNIETASVVSNSDSDLSKHSVSSENITSRPVRNRVKPINKDFIYDLNEFTDVPRPVSQSSNRNLTQYGKNLSRSLEELHLGKNKTTVKNLELKCKSDNSFNVCHDIIVNLNLQNKQTEDETASVDCKDGILTALEFKNEVIDIQHDNDVWIIEDE